MYDDVIALRDFYNNPLGQHVTGQMHPHITRFWQADTSCLNVMVGYGIGWLPPTANDHDLPADLLSLMLARSGVMAWPDSGPGRCSLVDSHA